MGQRSDLFSRRGVRQKKRCCKIRPRRVVDVAALGLVFYVGAVPFLVRHRTAAPGARQDAVDAPRREKIGENQEVSQGPPPLTRGRHGLPLSETPALIGSRRGRIDCDVNLDGPSYWNDPQGDRDRSFESPFAPVDGKTRYLTFEPDRGGWNNIRMSIENLIVFAAASGRTLVLPPDQPIYLLKADDKRKWRGFADFFKLNTESFNKIVPVITTKEFIEREGLRSGRLAIPESMRAGVLKAQDHCEHRNKSKTACMRVYEYYSSVAVVPELHGENHCLIFHQGYLNGKALNEEDNLRVDRFCRNRKPVYYDTSMRDAPHLHFRTSEKEYRLLAHFYAFQFFLDPAIDHFFKRFIRDHVRYRDALFCAAFKIVRALQEEGQTRGFLVDQEGGGGFSSMHIRRGDFQWSSMRISGEEWYENTRDVFQPKEVLYIATDERNRTFFDPIARHHDLKFLDNFHAVAGLDSIDPNYMSMIDAIVASRGRMFVGTYFSSFSAYIGRLRGYYGMSGNEMWYGQMKYKRATHEDVDPKTSYSSREFPLGWVGIDGDNAVTGFV